MGVFHPEIMWTARMPWVQWRHGALFSLGNDSHWDQSVMFALMHMSQAARTCMMTALRRPARIGSKLLGLPCPIFREMNTLAGLEQAGVSGNERKCLFFFKVSPKVLLCVHTWAQIYMWLSLLQIQTSNYGEKKTWPQEQLWWKPGFLF